MLCRSSSIVFAVSMAWLASAQFLCAAEAKPPITFDDHVQPILREKCAACHNLGNKSGGLDLSSYGALMEGGSSGAVIEAGDAGASYLFMLITHESEPKMPPNASKLADARLATIQQWINGGVLENSGSKAKLKPKTAALATPVATQQRPENPAMPPRMSLEPTFHSPNTTAVSALAASPWSPLIAVAAPQQVLLYHSESLQLLGVLPFPEGIPQVLRFSRNGDLLLAGGGRDALSGKVVVWQVATGERVIEVGDELDTVLAADISADHQLIALGGPSKVVRVYSTDSGELKYELRKHTDWITALEFSPDGTLLATADRTGGLLLWEAWTGREYLTLKGHTASVNAVSWRTDSNVLASGSEDRSIRLWELENGNQIKKWDAHNGVASVTFNRASQLLTCGRDNRARLWDQNGAQQAEYPPLNDLALETTYCNETNRVVAGDWKGSIRVFQAKEKTVAGELATNPPKLADRLANAEQMVATAKTKAQPLAEELKQTQENYNALTKQLADAKQQAGPLKATAEAKANELKTLQTSLAESTKALEVAKQTLATIPKNLPAMTTAAENALEAASNLPDDKQLAELAKQMQQVLDARTKQVANARATQQQQTAKLTASNQTLPAVQKASEQATAAWQQNTQQINQLKPQHAQAEQALAKHQPPAQAAAAALKSAEAEAARWRDEIAFHQLLTDLQTKQRAAADELAKRQQHETEQQAAAQQAAEAVKAGEAELQAIRAKLSAARQPKASK